MLNFGQKLDQIRIKKAKIIQIGLESEKRHFFHIVQDLAYRFSIKIEIWNLEGQKCSSFVKIRPNQGQKAQIYIQKPREANKMTFPHGHKPWLLIPYKNLRFTILRVLIEPKAFYLDLIQS